MNTTNYLENQGPVRQANELVVVFKETWTDVKQNIEYIRIFDSKTNIYIPIEKRSKSDIRKS